MEDLAALWAQESTQTKRVADIRHTEAEQAAHSHELSDTASLALSRERDAYDTLAALIKDLSEFAEDLMFVSQLGGAVGSYCISRIGD